MGITLLGQAPVDVDVDVDVDVGRRVDFLVTSLALITVLLTPVCGDAPPHGGFFPTVKDAVWVRITLLGMVSVAIDRGVAVLYE